MGKTQDTLHFKDHGISIILNGQEQSPQDPKVHVVLNEPLHVPPFSAIEVVARVTEAAVSQTWMVEGDKKQCCALMVARAVVKPVGTEIPLRLLNWRNEAVSIAKGTMVAEMELVADAERKDNSGKYAPHFDSSNTFEEVVSDCAWLLRYYSAEGVGLA